MKCIIILTNYAPEEYLGGILRGILKFHRPSVRPSVCVSEFFLCLAYQDDVSRERTTPLKGQCHTFILSAYMHVFVSGL